jgi:apolipoprotein N-acyltransferase
VGNVPQPQERPRHQQSAETIFEDHLRLTRDALLDLADHREEPLAVLWPETMVPWPFLDPALAAKFPEMWESEFNVLSRIREVVPERMSAPFLLGVNRYFVGRAGPQDELLRHDTTDSLFHVDATKVPPTLPQPDPKVPGWRPPWELVPGRHDKVVLVPWGECTPGGEWFPPLRRLRDAISIIPEITPGDAGVDPFFLGYVRPQHPGGPNREVLAGTIICFEIAFPARCRAWRERGASVLLNAANYAWYGDTGMPAQVMALGRLRAAELSMALAIAGNTGPTAILDPVGRVTAQVERGGKTQSRGRPAAVDPGFRTLCSRVIGPAAGAFAPGALIRRGPGVPDRPAQPEPSTARGR